MSVIRLGAPLEADRNALLDIWVLAWQNVLPQIDFASRRDWFDQYLRVLETDGAITLLALPDAGNLPAGFINYHPITGYIDQIAITPALQGAGLGKTLLEAAKNACPSGLTLKVNQQNPRAVRFYEREGFVISGEGISPASGLKLWEMVWRGAKMP